MRLSRWFTGAVVVAAASFLSSDSVGAQSVAQSQPVLKPAKERGTKPPELETLVSDCLARAHLVGRTDGNTGASFGSTALPETSFRRGPLSRTTGRWPWNAMNSRVLSLVQSRLGKPN